MTALFAPLTLAFAPASPTFGYTLDASRNVSSPNDQTDCPAGSGKACAPGNEVCGPAFTKAPQFHLMSQNGCAENDPNGPVFDPVHGVVHHFYQIHLAAPPGHGPDYGHFVSKDFVTWAELPVAIWNGVDASNGAATPYDNEAIFTGSAVVVDGAGPGGKGPGVVNIYPGLCNKNDWPGCTTGTLLAQAVPADYAGDELLVNWTKPSCAARAIRRTSAQFGAILRNYSAAPPPLQLQPDHRGHAARPVDAVERSHQRRVAAAHV